ncbi:MAG: hypothetical protein GY777_08220 [Candidatus Brocadiaceae bacterium]|nr:hypothetical protein [Candidatus Brocadiaceae bacterium]
MGRCTRTKHYTEKYVKNYHYEYTPLTKRFQDLTGEVFGKLQVIKLQDRQKAHTSWFVRCDCGSITTKKTNQLNRGVDRCTDCVFKGCGEEKAKGEDYYIAEIKRGHPTYQLINSYDGKARTQWYWYCSDCNTPFPARPTNLVDSTRKVCQCNTVRFAKWTKPLRERQLTEICKARGLKLLGWENEYKDAKSRVYLKCPRHEHYSISVGNLVTKTAEYGCPFCADEKKGVHLNHGFVKFIKDATKAHKGLFDYSEYQYTCSRTPSKITCNVCNESFKASYDNHVNKRRGCPACKGKNQKHTYIIGVEDGSVYTALKYGIATNTASRFKEHKRACGFELSLLSDWKFSDSISCKSAELEVKRNVDGSVLSALEFPSGNTETTYVYNLEYIESVYKKHGGVKVNE